MYKWVFCLLLKILCITPTSVLADTPIYIDVLVGALQDSSELDILKRTFFSILKSKSTSVQYRIKSTYANSTDLISSLQDTQNIGVIWIGHPALTLSKEEKNPQILNSFLKGANNRYLPKNILSAAHPELKFVSIVTCHNTDIIARYRTSLPAQTELITPEGLDFSVDDSKNPAFILTSLYLGPIDSFEKIESKMSDWLTTFKSKSKPLSSHQLSISYRDLLSKSFDYTVSINNRIIAVLNANSGFLPENKLNINLSASDMQSDPKIEIKADDPNRMTNSTGPVVDDIIITKIQLSSSHSLKDLINHPIHLGDEEINSDISIGLTDQRNFLHFEKALFSGVSYQVTLP